MPGIYPGARDAAITDEVFALVDWFNVMVYGNFSETKPGQHHSTYRMLEMSYDYWVKKRGLDPRKYVMGLPLYGLASGLPKKTSSTVRDQQHTYHSIPCLLQRHTYH